MPPATLEHETPALDEKTTTLSIEEQEAGAAQEQEQPEQQQERNLPGWAVTCCGLADKAGCTWVDPLLHVCCGIRPAYHARDLGRQIGLPILAILSALLIWHLVAKQVTLNEKEVPTPALVGSKMVDYFITQPLRQSEQREQYYADMLEMVDGDQAAFDEALAAFPFQAEPTIYGKIFASLQTVFSGFLIATLLAVPIGILLGLSRMTYEAWNPIIQVLKPISPIAWLPVLYAILLSLKAQHFDANGIAFPVDFAFMVAAVVVAVCSLWPTLINTANGVANVDRDYLNVSRVVKHSALQQIWRIILPASLPQIFTGLRLSFSIAWMVLIAAEMLSNSDGIGLFIWEMYNNGSSDSITNMLVAVIAIGIIGFILDRIMITLQKAVSFGQSAEIR